MVRLWSVRKIGSSHDNTATPSAHAASQLLAEADRLLTYASERHLLTPADAAQAKDLEQNVVQPLAKAMRDYRIDPSDATRSILLLVYSRLTALTGGVTGRSLADSEKSDGRLLELGAITIVSAAIATVLSTLSVAYPVQDTSKSPWPSVILYASLFCWGTFGSGLYLLKSLYDRIAEGSFDTRLLQGHRTRLLLGAALAAAVPRLFNLGPNGVDVDAVAVAVLTGLGVKVVYGVIENLVDALAQKFNLGSLRPTQPAAPNPDIAALPPPGGAGTSTGGAQGGQPPAVSALAEAQRRLAGLGKYSGPMDGQFNATMLAAVRDYIGDGITEDEARTISPTLLVQWLRTGSRPDNWRQQLADPHLVKVAASRSPKEVAANLDALQLLQARQWLIEAVDTSDAMAVERAVNAGLHALMQAFPAMQGHSFTQLLNALKDDTANKLAKPAVPSLP